MRFFRARSALRRVQLPSADWSDGSWTDQWRWPPGVWPLFWPLSWPVAAQWPPATSCWLRLLRTLGGASGARELEAGVGKVRLLIKQISFCFSLIIRVQYIVFFTFFKLYFCKMSYLWKNVSGTSGIRKMTQANSLSMKYVNIITKGSWFDGMIQLVGHMK